jgi:hypothetical protein
MRRAEAPALEVYAFSVSVLSVLMARHGGAARQVSRNHGGWVR